jgi:hypothetical protein
MVRKTSYMFIRRPAHWMEAVIFKKTTNEEAWVGPGRLPGSISGVSDHGAREVD